MQICFKDLSDLQWEIISKIINDQRKRKYSLRLIINSILSIVQKGTQLRNLEKHYPSWQLVYYYFVKWGKNRTLERLNGKLNKVIKL
jgi:putative transposase